MMIKIILENLSKENYDQLMCAFENEYTQFVELRDKRFIGVNIKPNPKLKILETAGTWSYGELL